MDGKGYVWEYIISSKGWNDLPEKEKIGIVKGWFKLEEAVVIDVYWPGIDCLTKNIFPDEVHLIDIKQH